MHFFLLSVNSLANANRLRVALESISKPELCIVVVLVFSLSGSHLLLPFTNSHAHA